MIRLCTVNDLDSVVAIWLEASILAHNFISPAYWEDKQNEMRENYIPNASATYVYATSEGEVVGFISLIDHYIAALFVHPKHQGCGVGTALLDKVKREYDCLELAVFEQNKKSHQYYLKQDFVEISRGIEENTQCREIVMSFNRR